ncbi:MAG: methyltransferase, partial [Candidatus Thioglobus sp.]|nr:methyltransferase [Candidatus Thioglobus sp.]
MSAIKAAFNKASSQYDDYAFLQKEIAMRLDEKLQVISQKPQLVVDLGAGTGLLTKPLLKRFPAAKIIALDFAEQTLKHNPAEAKI